VLSTRSILSLGLVLILTASCGVGGGAPGGDGAEGGGDAENDGEVAGDILFWHAYGEGPETEALNGEIIPAFEEQFPDATVEAVGFPYDELRQRLVTSMAGGSLPCVFRSDIIWVPEFAAQGILVPLDEEMDDFQEYAELVYEGALETSFWDGNYYGLPLSTNTRVLLYNADVIEQAGLDGPPATMDEFRELAEGLADTDIAVFADNDTAGWNLLPWIWSNGGAFTDDEITQASGHLNSPESVEAVEMLHDLYQNGQIPDLIIGAGGRDPAEGVAQGQYATMLDGPWMYPVFREQFPDFEVQSALMPEGDGGSVSVVGGEDIVLTQTCENRAAAVEFIRHMLNEESQTALAEAGQMSVRTDMAETLTEIEEYYDVFVQQLEIGARPRTPHPEWTRMEEALNNQVQTAFQGRQSVQEALDAAAAEIDTILEQEP
jgi:multiple sugar transport system substrate-binding protein